MLPCSKPWRLILILYAYLHLGFRNALSASCLPQIPCLYLSCLPHSLHAPYISLWFDHPNNIRWTVQIVNFLVTQSSHSPVTSSLLGPDILKHPQPMFFTECERPCFAPIQSDIQKYSFVYSIVYNFWVAKWKTNNLPLMITSIAWLQSALNFFLNRIVNCLHFLKLSELYRHFRQFIAHLYIAFCKLINCKITQLFRD